MLFDRPLASFSNNFIDIDRPKNHNTRLKVVRKVFGFLKIISFHTLMMTDIILRLCSFHLGYGGKNYKKSCLKYSIHSCFPTYFPASFLSRSPTQSRASRSRIKLKFTGHVQQNAPLLQSICSWLVFRSVGPSGLEA